MVFPLRVIQLCPYFKKATGVLLHQARSVHAAQPDNRHTHTVYTHTCCTYTQSHIMTSHLFVKYLFLCANL